MKKTMIAGLLAVIVAFSGCASVGKAPLINGNTIEMGLVVDKGNPDSMKDKQWENRVQIAGYMERGIMDLLRGSGYEAKLYKNASEFQSAPGKYLLVVSIEKYNPGSKAARMMVGFGAGAVSMDTKYDVYGPDASSVYNNTTGIASSKDWIYVVNKTNSVIVKAVNTRMNVLFPSAAK